MIVYILKNGKYLTKNINFICNQLHKNSNFSKSHSGLYTAIVVSKHARVGIDIEKIVVRSDKTIEYFFSKYKSFRIKGYLKKDLTSFYRSWTAMESYFKYTKKGFYSDKNFMLDLAERKVVTDSKEAFFTYLNYQDYLICICTSSAEKLENVQLIDDISKATR